MSKLHEIEKKLVSINEATFQNVCDELLYNTQDNYPDIVRTGSTVGKQKTRKGTPDTYFVLPNGRYILVEYTTKDIKESKKAFLQKAKNDILKCLDENKTKIKHKDIDKIIFCYNGKFTTNESQSLFAICSEKNVRLELKGLDSIALSLTGRCKHIAKEYLNVSIDSAQILSPKVFIEEYENSGFATPLSNRLYGRESELSTLVENFKTSQITILSGAPGVGKSRLVLEAISSLKAINKKITVYCLSNKSAPIQDDLRTYLSDDKPYLVFIDDGNRQSSNFLSLLGLLREKRKNKIHVVITVRDYALPGVKRDCVGYNTHKSRLLSIAMARCNLAKPNLK